MMFDVLKGVAVAIYAIALAALVGWLRGVAFDAVAIFAAAMLVVHAIEVPFVLRYLRRYRGSLAASIALNLLFGLLHWVPLKRAKESTWVS
jgi:hypothetical protein